MSRHLAIGDIHGCYRSLSTMVDFVGLRRDDIVITLGDYVNRGPESRRVVDWLIDFHASGRLFPLQGNHEIMLLHARQGGASLQELIEYGGRATLDSYVPRDAGRGTISDIPVRHWQFLESSLLPYYEIDRYFFVHANAAADLALADQSDHMLFWEKFDDPPRHASGKIMICGHTSQKSGLPKMNENAMCIDTRACGEGWLSCLHVESSRIWQTNEQGQTRSFRLDEFAALQRT